MKSRIIKTLPFALASRERASATNHIRRAIFRTIGFSASLDFQEAMARIIHRLFRLAERRTANDRRRARGRLLSVQLLSALQGPGLACVHARPGLIVRGLYLDVQAVCHNADDRAGSGVTELDVFPHGTAVA